MDLFGLKNDVMQELNREKGFIWKDIEQLRDKVATQERHNTELLDSHTRLKTQISSLKKSAPQHFKVLEQTARSVTALRSRIKIRNDELKKYLSEAEQEISLIRSTSKSASELHTSFDGYSERIEQIHAEITENNTLVKQGLVDASGHINELADLLARKEALEIDIKSISDNNDEAQKLFNSIKTLRASAIKERNEIEVAYDEVFGYDSEDDEGNSVRVRGKVETLEDSYKKIEGDLRRYYENNTQLAEGLSNNVQQIEQDYAEKFSGYVNTCKEQHDEALERINKLLPAALTAGLATAYDKKVEAESGELERHDKSFKLAIFLLITVSLLPVFIAYLYQFGDASSLTFIEVVDRIKSLTPYMFPLYAPVLWLAYSANKKYKLSKRLIEEYTHKGVLSKTFEGLSKQIQDTPNQEITEELRIKLLYNLVDVNSENPGKLISDYNKSDHPLMDALDKSSKLADSVTRLSRVPGFSALATHLDSKAKAMLDAEDKKISTVLTSDDNAKQENKESGPTIQ
ncbi:hypothetical protein BJG01_05755 [Vibrio splendidus]|nr:hypothetical protein BJG01_05755 [Vibrio splendidus]